MGIGPDVVVAVSHLHKSYGRTVALDALSFSVRAGEIFGLLGPNGAGKTTAFECVEGLRRPDGGAISVAGVNPVRDPRAAMRLLGVQLQSSSLPPTMTCREAMAFFAAYHRVAVRLDLLERMGLGDHTDVHYENLSTGLKRRLALALAVAHDPAVLVLDEPTAGLDVASRVELHRLISEMAGQGTAVMLATHDMAEAETMADRVAVLLRGRIVIEGTPREITAGGVGASKVTLRTQHDTLLDEASEDGYLVRFTDDPGAEVVALLGRIEAAGDTLVDLRVERPSLEERFLELTRGGK
ncbi:MAG: ABC transporter ATP-binding protein [Acidimicrobiia bacterium]